MGDLFATAVAIVDNANGVIAAAMMLIGVATILLFNKTKVLEKRIDEYDKLHMEATMSQITTDLAWIKSKLIELTQK